MSTDDATATPDSLAACLDGEVDFRAPTRRLYATDASIYEVEPSGVVFPRTREDVQAVVEFARDHDTSITARGAGSSLTGNAIGEGIVVDCERHLDAVLDVDPDAETATVQPGVVLDELNDLLAEHDRYFPPDPSTSSTCTIGGMVANDAGGPHSVRHGTTRDNVQRVECVLADGSVAEFRCYEGDELAAVLDREDRVGAVHRTVRNLATEHADEIAARYPDIERNSSGYDLESSVGPDGEWFNLSRLIVGSEGTLCIITEVTLELTARLETRAAALVFYDDIVAAADAVPRTLDADPSAVELIDDAVLGYARDAWGFDLVPGEAGAALLVEVETTHAAQERDLDTAVEAARTDATVAVERATDDATQDRLWTVRKASNPLLNRRMGDEQAPSFIEDAAVPPEALPDYLERVRNVLRAHELEGSVFGHAGQGVLHIKPFLNLQDEADRKALRAVSEAVHDIVLDVGGCVSGEHGDGRLRSEYLPQMYGEELYSAFVEVKRAFDPEDVCNPAKVVPSRDGKLVSVDEHLRYEGYDPAAIDTALDFGDEGGFDSLIEQCNGCSKCRTAQGGVMCPSYRATGEEITSTRGRANMLRAAIDGELGKDALTSDEFQAAVLDRCLACKACETECPTGVDMAKLKIEAKHQKHQEKGVPLRARLFGNVRTLNRVGSALAPLANRLTEFAPGRVLAEKTLGIDRRRTLPAFATEPFPEWVASHEPNPTAGERGTVALFPDCYTAYNHPEVGRATVRLLESLGYAVEVPEVDCCGRAALSQGLVDRAHGFAETNVDVLGEYAARSIPVVGVEPSCISALTEYGDLLNETSGVPEVSRTVASFLRERVDAGDLDFSGAANTTDASVAFHGHCHATTKGWDADPVVLLRHAGYEVWPVDATCCGMAGAFGYETEHYDLSTALGAELEAKLDATEADIVAASGASCRQQLADCDVETHHPMELLAEVVE